MTKQKTIVVIGALRVKMFTKEKIVEKVKKIKKKKKKTRRKKKEIIDKKKKKR